LLPIELNAKMPDVTLTGAGAALADALGVDV
jgi:hypothetical protein